MSELAVEEIEKEEYDKERIIRMLNFQEVDHVPLLGGFLVSGSNYREILSGCPPGGM